MAAVRLPKPGTEYGPCEGGCAHIDCNATREMALAQCRFCGKPIGYDTRLFSDPNDRKRKTTEFVHADCLEETPSG